MSKQVAIRDSFVFVRPEELERLKTDCPEFYKRTWAKLIKARIYGQVTQDFLWYRIDVKVNDENKLQLLQNFLAAIRSE
jgi:hypothetical protein